jgi:outer membrane protein assembly factor BamB
MRRIVLLLLVTALAAPAALAKGAFPDTIPLPNNFQPEGIATGLGDTFYVGSIPSGAVYTGSLRTGKGRILVPGAAGRSATGLKYNRGLLWVSGGGTGKAFVYSARSGTLSRELQLAAPPTGATFVNDVVVTNRAAYFTDSNRPVLYRVAVSRNGTPGAVTLLSLTGDYAHVDGKFNLNGIDATRDGRTLVTVQSETGKLFLADARTGRTKEIDLGGKTLPGGDGILLVGRTLYVVQNQLNKIAVVRLSANLLRGSVTREITDSDFDVPTTIAPFGKWLYAVNARFGTATEPNPRYDVVKVRR